MVLLTPRTPQKFGQAANRLYRCDRVACGNTFSRKPAKQKGSHDFCNRQCAALHRAGR